jgi:hypothetical protein
MKGNCGVFSLPVNLSVGFFLLLGNCKCTGNLFIVIANTVGDSSRSRLL